VSEEFPVLQLIVASQMTEQLVVDNQQKSVCCANPEKKSKRKHCGVQSFQ